MPLSRFGSIGMDKTKILQELEEARNLADRAELNRNSPDFPYIMMDLRKKINQTWGMIYTDGADG